MAFLEGKAQSAANAITTLARNQRLKPYDPNSPIVQDQNNDDPVGLEERVKARAKTYSGVTAVVYQWGPGGFSDETNIEGSTGKTSARWSGVSCGDDDYV